MGFLDSNSIIIILCATVILSYFFSLISLKSRIPSVLLLLSTGIGIKYLVLNFGIEYSIPMSMIELFGTVGLIMIILEAGLDLKVGRKQIKLIRDSAFSAIISMLVSVLLVALIIKYWLNQPLINSMVYAIPMSIISGAIVIPSLQHLTKAKREFLVYEASFSDILGILFFNFIVTEHAMSFLNISKFFLSFLAAAVIALLTTLFLFFLLTRSQVNVKFFLAFSILILLYISGEVVHMPSLIIILVFGLIVSNWEKINNAKLIRIFPHSQIEGTRELLHSLTAESSFLIRTFFFILFGYSIDLSLLISKEVILVGSAIVFVMLLVRYFYLKLFVKSNIFPELFYMPRGLITILLFYKIPSAFQLTAFNEGILFFVVLSTGIIMMTGAVLYKVNNGQPASDEIFEQG